MSAVPGRRAASVVLMLISAACVPHTPPTSPAGADHTWQIVDHELPGVSAMTAADAAAWHGRFVHLQPRQASNGVATCAAPTYRESTHPAAAYMGTEYRVPLAALGAAHATEVRVIEVMCDGQPWLVPGGRILSLGPGAEFTVWDGAFFRLQRVHP